MTRVAQGWSLLDPRDAKPYADVWLEQLDKAGVSPELYRTLFDMSVQRRKYAMHQGLPVPPFTVELFLVAFDDYKSQVRTKTDDYRDFLKRLDKAEEMVESGAYNVARAVEYAERSFTPRPVIDFKAYLAEERAKANQKIQRILQDAHLDGTA